MVFLPNILIILISYLSGELRKKFLFICNPSIPMNRNN